MKFTKLFLWLPLVALLLLPACAGTSARDTVLLPAMSQAWEGISEDALYGGADPIMVGEFSLALQNDNILAIRESWDILKGHAETGIQKQIENGIISVMVAASLRERLRMFDEAMYTMMFNEQGVLIEAAVDTIEGVVE